jgi:hypothetical protein
LVAEIRVAEPRRDDPASSLDVVYAARVEVGVGAESLLGK